MRRAQQIEAAVLQEVVLNSPLLRRKLLQNQSKEENEKKNKGSLKKLLRGILSSIRNVVISPPRKENSLALTDLVATGKIFFFYIC